MSLPCVSPEPSLRSKKRGIPMIIHGQFPFFFSFGLFCSKRYCPNVIKSSKQVLSNTIQNRLFRHPAGQDGADHDQKDDSCEILAVQDAGFESSLGYDQSNLSAGHHADSDLEAVRIVKAEHL